MNEIRTTDPKWIIALSKAYKDKTPALLIDDAHIGVDPRSDNILSMGRKANLGVTEWVAVLISLGVAAAGVYLLVIAILDPEPFGKIAAALGFGTVMIMGGGLTAVKILAKVKPPSVKVNSNGSFEIGWD